MKKPAKKIIKKTTPLVELIKDNHYLHQYCDFINSENQRNSIKCLELMSYVTILEKVVKENGKMLEFVVQNLSPKTLEKMKKEFEEKGFTIGSPSKSETTTSNRSPEMSTKPAEQKSLAFHDDITVKCKNCKSISIAKDVACKECGFKN